MNNLLSKIYANRVYRLIQIKIKISLTPFYNKPIKKPKVKRLKNIDQLTELPFYQQLDLIKTGQAFSGYAMSYKVEITEEKDPIVQLKASKLSIRNLFKDLLNEAKGFKY